MDRPANAMYRAAFLTPRNDQEALASEHRYMSAVPEAQAAQQYYTLAQIAAALGLIGSGVARNPAAGMVGGAGSLMAYGSGRDAGYNALESVQPDMLPGQGYVTSSSPPYIQRGKFGVRATDQIQRSGAPYEPIPRRGG